MWYRLHLRNGRVPFASWDAFASALRAQFTEANFLRKTRDRLAQLKQTGSVQRYLHEFSALCLEIPDLADGEQLHRFMYGLKPAIRQQVELHKCSTFEEAATTADTVDQTMYTSARGSYIPPTPPRRDYREFQRRDSSRSGPTPMEIDALRMHAMQRQNRAFDSRGSAPPPMGPRLTPEERARLRDANACFYCRKPGHMMSECPERAGRNRSFHPKGPRGRTQGR